MTTIAAEFDPTFLATVDEIELNREPIFVTKNGKPVAKLVPLEIAEGKDPLDKYYFGKIEIVGDIESPIYTDEEYEQFYREKLERLK